VIFADELPRLSRGTPHCDCLMCVPFLVAFTTSQIGTDSFCYMLGSDSALLMCLLCP